MIKANRLILCSEILYDDVKIYSYGETGGEYIPGLFEKYQLFLSNSNTKATISMNMVSMIQLRRERPRPYMHQVKRIVVTYGQISFGPAWLIPEDKYSELNIPFLFGYDYKDIEHCAFIADGWLYLTKDELVISVEH
jgi:hypothetical protein